MRAFMMYRTAVPEGTHTEGTENAPDEPQFEGVEFEDGTVVIRWMTAFKSTTFWDSMEDMMAVHGHPEYGSVLVYHEVIPQPTVSVDIAFEVDSVNQNVTKEEMAAYIIKKASDYHRQRQHGKY